MKKNYLSCALFIAMLAASSANAQKNQVQIQKKVLDKQGNLSMARFDTESKYSVAQAKEAIKQDLNLTNSSFKEIELENDPLGFTHQKQQQFYKGIKVEFGEYTFHSKNGAVATASGKVFKIEKENVTASLSKEAGLQKAMSHVGATKYLWQGENTINYKKPEGDLVLLPAIKGVSETARIAYKYDIYSQEPLYRADVYIDAQNGEVIFENHKIHHVDTPATGTSLYNGTVSFTADVSGNTYSLLADNVQTYDMNQGTNYNSASSVTSSSSFFSGNATAVQAHWGAEQTYDYFNLKHGRDSYNGNGAVIRSYVSYSSNYVNAFWDGSRMTYGDGDGTNYGPLVSLDIVGHEIAHGVTQYAANLIYSYESGALNESFSDIFGESIEFYAQGTNDWLMGDQIGAGGSGGALRSMSNPNIYSQPDTYYGDNWYTGSGDNGGVHYNSGVQNFWFYLLTVGGSGTNDNGDAYTVTQIGMDAAAAVAYRNLTVYLSASSQHDDAREGAIQAAIDLYGAGSTEVIAVTNAWYAVGIGDAYDNGGGTDPGTPSECSTTVSSFPYAESFESGDGWTQASGDDGNWVRDASGTPSSNTGPSAGADGSYYMFLEASTNGSTGQIGANATAILESPCFDLSGQSSATFTFENHMYGSNVGSLELQASTDGAAWSTLWSDSGNQGNQWNEVSINLTSYLGESSVRLRLVGTTGSGWSSDIAIDNLALTTSGGSTGDTSAPTAPSNVSASSITETSVTISWSAATDNVGVTGYNVYQGNTLLGQTTNTSASVSSLTAGTTYTFYISAYDAAGNESSTDSVTFTTSSSSGGGDVTYCDSEGSNSSYEWIDYVAFGGMTNTTGNDGGYADYTNNVATVAPGSTNTLVFSCGFSSSSYTEYWAVWIDYNQDGTFDTSEEVASGSSSSADNLSVDVTIPSTATLGTTRMRVSMKYNGTQTACETFTYGEVEDYTVNITNTFIPSNSFASIASNTTELGNEAGFALQAYPNPATNTIKVNLASKENVASYKILNTIGQVVMHGKLIDGNINISSLQKGIYLLQATDGQKDFTSKLIKN